VCGYADGLLLHRQSAFYARQVIDLDRSTLAGGIGGDADGAAGRTCPAHADEPAAGPTGITVVFTSKRERPNLLIRIKIQLGYRG
jgi:hypothetical protein